MFIKFIKIWILKIQLETNFYWEFKQIRYASEMEASANNKAKDGKYRYYLHNYQEINNSTYLILTDKNSNEDFVKNGSWEGRVEEHANPQNWWVHIYF